MMNEHTCANLGDPPMNKGLKIKEKWFGWVIEFKGTEIKITYCPNCREKLKRTNNV